jgi:hypothetical protein
MTQLSIRLAVAASGSALARETAAQKGRRRGARSCGVPGVTGARVACCKACLTRRPSEQRRRGEEREAADLVAAERSVGVEPGDPVLDSRHVRPGRPGVLEPADGREIDTLDGIAAREQDVDLAAARNVGVQVYGSWSSRSGSRTDSSPGSTHPTASILRYAI